jgi:hypothetical protein
MRTSSAIMSRRKVGECELRGFPDLRWSYRRFSYFMTFALLIASLTVSSTPHKTAIESLSDPLQNGSLVSPLSDELRVILFITRSTRRVFTTQIEELSTAIISLPSHRGMSNVHPAEQLTRYNQREWVPRGISLVFWVEKG